MVQFLQTLFFFFNDTATTEIYTLSLHDALPICSTAEQYAKEAFERYGADAVTLSPFIDRKSTRLNSSHSQISYAVFCLKKKNDLSSDYRLFIINDHTMTLMTLHRGTTRSHPSTT